jgi:hypothetical protein
MGLDQYLYAERILDSKKAKDALVINYLESLNLVPSSMQDEYGFFLSEWDAAEKVISDTLNSFKLYGQVGKINTVRQVKNKAGILSWVIRTESMYWRKENHIHAWFVDNCQGGVDDCGTYPVDSDYIEEFIVIASDILKDRSLASELMPTQSGFFFGGTEYHKWYFEALKSTRTVFRKLLKPSTKKNWSLFYHASW